MGYNMGKPFELDSFDAVDIVLGTDDTFSSMIVDAEEKEDQKAEDIVKPYVEAGLVHLEAYYDIFGETTCERSSQEAKDIENCSFLDEEADDIVDMEDDDELHDDLGEMIDAVVDGDYGE